MLELKNITKDYKAGDEIVHALKGVSLTFREHEFVSVLGPSGCGKTTLLNIIGGLDHYSGGELFIDGVSTKDYSDRDWDTYRNHRIGFVFQSYNLIPHQTVSANVELALNISGISKEERVRRAHEALDKVGLADQYNKKPNQLSGGQMQRVAIARALVNDPEILLADEPTGALDTVTSVQIMDLIKEISSECLVIMVTHNPDLAEKYSSRIINLLDGLVTSDSHPVAEDEPVKAEVNVDADAEASAETTAEADAGGEMYFDEGQKPTKKDPSKKSKLSFWSAFKLSAKNLLSKLKRTIMVCFAGSIGIIGVATVLSVSTGVRGYIDKMQNDMLSGNPVTVQASAINLERLMAMADTSTQIEAVKNSVVDGKINVNYMIKFLSDRSDDLASLAVTNNITKEYVDYVTAMDKNDYAAIDLRYGVTLANNIYTDYHFNDNDGDKMSLSAAQEKYTAILGKTQFAEYASLISMVTINYKQAPSSADFISTQYDILNSGGKIATEANELMLVVDKDTQLTDLLLAQLGYFDQDQFLNIAYKAKGTDSYDPSKDKDRFDYDELVGKKFTWYPNDDVFVANTNPMTKTFMPFNYNPVAGDDWEGGIELKVSAILRPKKDLSYGCLSSGIYYTSALTQKVLESAATSKIVQFLEENKDADAYKSQRFTSGHINYGGFEMDAGITYRYNFEYDGTMYNNNIGFVGKQSEMAAAAGMFAESMPGMSGMLDALGLGDSVYLTRRELGGADIPSTIAVYSYDFEQKDRATAYLDKWNDGREEKIQYTDTLSLIIDLVNNLITAITAALIAFTSLSLVVSTVMIAIITYVSVIERVKEIGVIRSLGGRKRDVSALFISETFIIGLISGVFGIFITFLLTLLINGIVNHFVTIGSIATLTIPIVLIMIGISIFLTLISGLIPARIAAKKDPVEALRTE